MGSRFMFFPLLRCHPCSETYHARKFLFGHQAISYFRTFLFSHQMPNSVLQRSFETHRLRRFPLGSDVIGETNTVRCRASHKHSLRMMDKLRFLNLGETSRPTFPLTLLKVTDSVYSKMQTRKRTLHTSANWTPSLFHSKPAAVATDVVLFEHDRTGFFKLLSVFCACQLLFWTYLAHFAFTSLRDPKPEGKKTDKGGRSRGDEGIEVLGLSLGSNVWRFGFTGGCLCVGGAIVLLGLLYSRRSVSRVVLHKGGTMVTLTTQSPLGVDKAPHIRVPLSNITSHAHRIESPSFIPIRVKGHRFYFLLDKDGKLNNAKLFDITVGAFRPF